jgi:HEAT repeat protein
LNDIQAANAAAGALASIGKDALPALLDALTNGTSFARLEVAGVMASFGPDTEEAVPALVECLRHEDAGVRGNAIASLQAIPKRPDLAVPALTACLTDADVGVRGNAATVIRKFGHDAEPAVSNLVHLARDDTDSFVRTRATESLRLIAPERAEKEGL